MGEKDPVLGEWERLDRDERNSTVAHFKTGWVNDDGGEVLIWHGVEEEDGSISIEGYEGDEDYEYVIESLPEQESGAPARENERYAKGYTQAKFQALRAMAEDFS